MNLRAVVERIHHVRCEAIGRGENADVARIADPRQDDHVNLFGGIEAEMRQARLQPFP